MDAQHGIDPGFRAVIALFDNIGTIEMMIVAVVALLLFGKRLPEVASQAGSTIAKFRRGLDGAIQDSGVEREIRKIKAALPSDLSVGNAARAAARKFEDRVRDVVERPIEEAAAAAAADLRMEPGEARPAGEALAPASPATAPPAGAPPSTAPPSTAPPSTAPPSTAPPSTAAPVASPPSAAPPVATPPPGAPPAAPSADRAPGTNPAPSNPPPSNPATSNPSQTSPGADPASRFVPPGSVPRE